MDFSEAGGSFWVRVEAEGYEPAMSPRMDAQPSEQEQDFRLHRKDPTPIRGVVLLPDGQPVANTSLVLLTFEQAATLDKGLVKRRDDRTNTTTDAQGNFELDRTPQAHTLVAAGPANGFGLLRMHRSVQPFKVQLRPWGRIEGRVVLAGKPAPNQQVKISLGLPAYTPVHEGLIAGFHSISTDTDGRFAFELVPPGEVTLVLSYGLDKPSSHQTKAEVHAGETVRVQIGGRGRLVTGKLVLSDGGKTDWLAQLISGSMFSNRKRPEAQPPPDSEDFAGRLKLLDFFDQSEEWRAYRRAGGSFPMGVAADGSFSVEDVPPGPYLLNVSLADSANTGNDSSDPWRRYASRMQRKAQARLHQDVVVPGEPGDSTPVDLGTFSVKVNLPVDH